VFNSPQIRKVTVHNPQLKSVCTKGARMSWTCSYNRGPPKLIHIFITPQG
jgi:hypothetical protein